MPCSRTQHGLTRVGLEPPTSGSGVRGINHQATALPTLVLGTTYDGFSGLFLSFEINFIWFVIARFDLVHDMAAIYGLC